MLVIWNERARPPRLIRCGGSPVMLRPRSRISPAEGGKIPGHRLDKEHVTVAGQEFEIDAADHFGRVEGFGHVDELKGMKGRAHGVRPDCVVRTAPMRPLRRRLSGLPAHCGWHPTTRGSPAR